jgi:acyl carrier protein
MTGLLQFRDGVLAAHDDDVLDAIDSLGLVELIKFIQNEFDIQIGLEEVTITRFHDLPSIVDFIVSKTTAVEAQ